MAKKIEQVRHDAYELLMQALVGGYCRECDRLLNKNNTSGYCQNHKTAERHAARAHLRQALDLLRRFRDATGDTDLV